MDEPEAIRRSDAELDVLLTDVYACTRVWDAWAVGTMTEADFRPAAETDLRADLIAWRDAAATKVNAAPAFRVKITVTGNCGHLLWTGFDKVDEKYPFWCDECDDCRRNGKYPWKLVTEIVSTGPTVIAPHDDGSSYCTSLPLHDHDLADASACPIYRPDDNGDRWPCVLGMAHNTAEDSQQTVHRDQFGNEFRVARCQVPAVHGMPHCWCAIPGHHKPLEPAPCRCGHLYRSHNAVMSRGTRGFCHECSAGECPRYEDAAAAPPERPARPVFEVMHADEITARTYLLGCGCQVTPTYGATVGAPYVCAEHGDTTVTMTIPLGAATCEGGC